MNGNLLDRVEEIIDSRRILILGYGAEGKSTFKFFKKLKISNKIIIADRNKTISDFPELENIELHLGENYLDAIMDGDFLFKSPGISFKNLNLPTNIIISSQTDIFLKLFKNQVIGVTGTKGKSTTVSLIHHILAANFDSVFLVGNIGVPALDEAPFIKSNSIVVYEMSSHQLEYCTNSPKVAVLLNLHQEHLDHYTDYQGYRNAKWKISETQTQTDFFIFNSADQRIELDLNDRKLQGVKLPVSLEPSDNAMMYYDGKSIWHNGENLNFSTKDFKLRGRHNIFNLMVALMAANQFGLSPKKGIKSAYDFHGLAHRLEYVGFVKGIHFYNDSIATIPEATINALKSIDEVDSLILGGFDRQINYDGLIDFLFMFKPLNIMLLGDVGKRIFALLNSKKYNGVLIQVPSLSEAVLQSFKLTKKGKACLLSPAAASYDSFRNFEDRGNQFKMMVLSSEN